jgi:hypothetical protein
MGLFIGDANDLVSPSTWGSLRSIVYNGNITGGYLNNFGDNNVEYAHGFKTVAGNGFIRTDYSAIYEGFSGQVGTGIGANFTAVPGTATPPESTFGSYYNNSSSGMMVAEDRAQFTGETAVLSSGSITIDADAFIAPYYQIYGAYDYSEAITSIGKLTAF